MDSLKLSVPRFSVDLAASIGAALPLMGACLATPGYLGDLQDNEKKATEIGSATSGYCNARLHLWFRAGAAGLKDIEKAHGGPPMAFFIAKTLFSLTNILFSITEIHFCHLTNEYMNRMETSIFHNIHDMLFCLSFLLVTTPALVSTYTTHPYTVVSWNHTIDCGQAAQPYHQTPIAYHLHVVQQLPSIHAEVLQFCARI